MCQFYGEMRYSKYVRYYRRLWFAIQAPTDTIFLWFFRFSKFRVTHRQCHQTNFEKKIMTNWWRKNWRNKLPKVIEQKKINRKTNGKNRNCSKWPKDYWYWFNFGRRLILILIFSFSFNNLLGPFIVINITL